MDDGKSTLIGRLLHDANGVYEDQLASVRAASESNGIHDLDFSFVTDGLRAEREQGITIDVAYRYFSTPRRKFIIADTPGHEQYTQNMATGASTASLAVLLMDVCKGLLPQTRRHAVIAWLLGIRSFVVAANKMDLVGFRESAFQTIEYQFLEFLSKLGNPRVYFVPTCSLGGDNVVHRSVRTPWFEGPSLLEYLETTPVSANYDFERFRFPVQYVTRAPDGTRRYVGQVASGVLWPGNSVAVLPSGYSTEVDSIWLGDQELECAFPPLSISVVLKEDVDVSRGDMLVCPDNPPQVTQHVTAMLLWLSRAPLEVDRPYLIKHSTRQVCATITRVSSVIDPDTLDRRPDGALKFNEFGECEIETQQPLCVDSYDQNRVTGSFIVLEPLTNHTVGAGMVLSATCTKTQTATVVRGKDAGLTIWFTGLSSSGKTTISRALYEKLWAKGYKVERLDGDVVRRHLSKGLGFSRQDRDENIRRIGFVAEILARNGLIVLVSAISPYRDLREEMRNRIGNFLEVYVHASVEACEERDIKGIYSKARAGAIPNVTGVNDPYEHPLAPDVECRTDRETLAQSVSKVLEAVEHRLSRLA